jgi:multiple sugar transport system substrate-binding protein
LPKQYLSEQLQHSTGYSHLSYHYNNKQWALAIDAATPAASFRADLLQANDQMLPGTWEEVLALAGKGKVAVPAIPIDLLMNFYTFCIAHGTEPFHSGDEIVDRRTGMQAIETMKQLYGRVDKEMFGYNPIAVAEIMSSSSRYWYCPFAYCYSNYSRVGYGTHVLHYTNLVTYDGAPLRSTIGGTGLAVSASSQHREVALDFAAMVASGLFQRTVYVQHGGQPGHRSAWVDAEANRLTNDFFRNILPAMENGYVRPRYNGYLHFQDSAGWPLQQCLKENGRADLALDEMNRPYRESLTYNKTMVSL